MFGDSVAASEPSPAVLAPARDKPSKPRSTAVPPWLLPWLVPLAVVLIIVAGVTAPGYVALPLGLVLIAGIVWVLLRSSRGQDSYKIYGMPRHDGFLKGQDNDEMMRSDRLDRDDRSE